jgi:hypothetical protein
LKKQLDTVHPPVLRGRCRRSPTLLNSVNHFSLPHSHDSEHGGRCVFRSNPLNWQRRLLYHLRMPPPFFSCPSLNTLMPQAQDPIVKTLEGKTSTFPFSYSRHSSPEQRMSHADQVSRAKEAVRGEQGREQRTSSHPSHDQRCQLPSSCAAHVRDWPAASDGHRTKSIYPLRDLRQLSKETSQSIAAKKDIKHITRTTQQVIYKAESTRARTLQGEAAKQGEAEHSTAPRQVQNTSRAAARSSLMMK